MKQWQWFLIGVVAILGAYFVFSRTKGTPSGSVAVGQGNSTSDYIDLIDSIGGSLSALNQGQNSDYSSLGSMGG